MKLPKKIGGKIMNFGGIEVEEMNETESKINEIIDSLTFIDERIKIIECKENVHSAEK